MRSVDRCHQVRLKAEQKVKAVQQKIAQLKKLEQTLKNLISDCKNRIVTDCCPIIEKMET